MAGHRYLWTHAGHCISTALALLCQMSEAEKTGSTLRVKFELDEATVMKLRPVVEKLAYTRAA